VPCEKKKTGLVVEGNLQAMSAEGRVLLERVPYPVHWPQIWEIRDDPLYEALGILENNFSGTAIQSGK
jgi:hypothetical protein